MHLVSLQRMYSVSKRNVNVLILSVRRNVAIEILPFCRGMNHTQGDDRFNGKGSSHLRGRHNDVGMIAWSQSYTRIHKPISGPKSTQEIRASGSRLNVNRCIPGSDLTKNAQSRVGMGCHHWGLRHRELIEMLTLHFFGAI